METTQTIRKLDAELYRKARAEAIRQGKSIGGFLNELIKDYFGKQK